MTADIEREGRQMMEGNLTSHHQHLLWTFIYLSLPGSPIFLISVRRLSSLGRSVFTESCSLGDNAG